MSDDIMEFSFLFKDLDINPASLEILMGFYPGTAPEPFSEFISTAISEASDLFEIKSGYRRMHQISMIKETRQIAVADKIFTPGNIVFSEIRKSVEVALFAATAGHGITQLCHAMNEKGNTVYSYILDVLGSVVVEKAAEKMLDILESEVIDIGWNISESYSPGYCTWSVAEQQILFSFLPPGFSGITLSPSSLMIPVKSVSGIVGLGPLLKRNNYKCRQCNDENCIYGKMRREMTEFN